MAVNSFSGFDIVDDSKESSKDHDLLYIYEYLYKKDKIGENIGVGHKINAECLEDREQTSLQE